VELGDELLNVLETYEQLIEAHGPPPPHFHQVKGCKHVELPGTEGQGPLFDLLLARQTARVFRTDLPLSIENLSILLRYTFGAQGAMRVTDDYVVLKKTSPSGGALHPIEAYPLILNVEGVDPGIYHYNVLRHGLDQIRAIDTDEGRELARRITGGQYYFASANALIILTARFDRNFWKYRNDSKALRILELDSAHLAQTFYLIGTDLGLGTFTTGAIIDETIEKLLGLPLFLEGAISVVGCGYPVDESCPGGAEFSAL
jgi:putative peptide maturation dehydrogenase